MSKPTDEQTVESYFGEVISTYTRAQALEDGVLVDAGPMAEEAGFTGPVALTSAVWENCVAWTDTDNQRQVYQNQSARLWDLLSMAGFAIRANPSTSNQLLYELYRVPRDGHSTKAQLVQLKLIIGLGDHDEIVLTILTPTQD
jgi:hypothetical protein